MRISEKAAAILILISLLYGAILYPGLPEMVASHWNFEGDVDGCTPRLMGVLFLPSLALVLLLVFALLPGIDPLRANLEAFRRYYDGFVVLMIGFLMYLHVLTLLWNTGQRFEIIRLLAPAFAVLIYYTGVMLENSRPNWFVGIRTPWTMSSEGVWERTNRLAGRLFKISAGIALLGAILPGYALILLILPVVASSIFTIAYSYIEYRKERAPS